MTVTRLNPDRPAPPKHLNATERRHWREIVNSQPGGYFQPGDWPLLANYCRFWRHCDALAALMHEEPDNLKLIGQLVDASKALANLAVKLRLCPSTRLRADSAKLSGASAGRPWES